MFWHKNSLYIFCLSVTVLFHGLIFVNNKKSKSFDINEMVLVDSALSVQIINSTKERNLQKKNQKKLTSKTQKSKSKVLGNSINNTQNEFLEGLRKLIEKRKYFPTLARSMGQMGAVKVAFDILEDGRITNVRVITSSDYPLLDNAALITIKNVGIYKPIPKELSDTRISMIQKITFKK